MTTLEKFRLSSVTWDSDRDPNGFLKWSSLISSLVRSTQHGAVLEDFLDAKLGRRVYKPSTVPSFLADPDFDMPDTSAGADSASGLGSEAGDIGSPLLNTPHTPDPPPTHHPEGDDDEGDARSEVGSVLGKATIPYRDLPTESINLDCLMYNVLRMNIKGSKASLLECVAFPSYVQAICVLHKHMDISKSDRKTQAFASMDKLQLKTDVKSWHIEAISAVQELLDSKCTIMDYALIYDSKKSARQKQNYPIPHC